MIQYLGEKFNQLKEEIPAMLQQTQADLDENEENKQLRLEPKIEQSVQFTKIYNIQNVIGSGGCADVKACVHKITDQQKAVKIMIPNTQTPAMFQQEVAMLKKLDHPNIVKIEGAYEQNKNYILFEECAGGELFDFTTSSGTITEQQASIIMKQLLSAVAYCHSHSIVHRDIKPDEILLFIKNDQTLCIKLADFGNAAIIEPENKLKGLIGSPYYVAPEVLSGSYDEKCDLWSCGVILYILMFNYPPFSGHSPKEIMENVQKGRYQFDDDVSISQEARDLISNLLQVDSKKRYSARQALQHPWIQNYSQKQDNLPLIRETLYNLKYHFNKQTNQIQNAIYQFIVTHFISAEEKKDLIFVFNELDLNSDGLLDQEELMSGFKKIMSDEGALNEVEQIMSSVGKKSIGYSEYLVAAASKKNVLTQEILEKTFKTIDIDGSGKITINNLKSMFGNGKISDSIWEQLFKEFAQGFIGDVSLYDFQSIMMRLKE